MDRHGIVSIGVVILAVALGAVEAARSGTRQVPPMLVFERGGDLYRMTVDGSETVRLTATTSVEGQPAVSSDGLRIAFVRNGDELWTTDLQGTSRRRVVPRRPASIRYASTGSPTWSPDGRSLFFDRVSQTPNEICGSIFRVAANGGRPIPVTDGVRRARLDTNPDVASSGDRIVLSTGECEPGFGQGLAVVTTSGRATRDLRRLGATRGVQHDPAWAPDGRRIAFVVYDSDGTGRRAVHVVNRDGSGLQRLTRWAFDLGDPDWSPDGQWIAFHDLNRGLFLIRPDGTGVQRVPGTRAKDAGPAWVSRS